MWAWGIARVDAPNDSFEYGTQMDEFMFRCSIHNSTYYFHNLKFDGRFILDWLLKHDFYHVETDGMIGLQGFKTLISDMGQFYSITVRWENGHQTEFRDSLKKLPMTVSRIAKSFQLPELKGEIDYEAPRSRNYVPTPEEVDYLRRDVSIVGQAMKLEFEQGMKKLTVAADSMADFKKMIGPDTFKALFPVFSSGMDGEIRRAYRGGFTYKDPRRQGVQGSGIVLDVNSLYPSVMRDQPLPYGEPEFVDGKVEPTPARPLTVFSITFTAKLKPGHIPCIQIKGTSIFSATEYLSEIPEPTTLMVTNVDWDLYQDHYDIDVIEYGGGWRFHAMKGIFNSYIEKWGAVKEASTGGIRELAKLHLTSLYGKFASNPNVTGKIPVLDEEGIVQLVRGQDATRAPVYTAMGVFITAYARDLTIRAAQANYGTFAYADTDSLHLLTDDIPDGIDVHPTRLGAWKFEYSFDAALYIRAKAYLERKPDGSYVNRIAGLPEHVSGPLTFDAVTSNVVLHGKLLPVAVPGGVVLKDVPFELKL